MSFCVDKVSALLRDAEQANITTLAKKLFAKKQNVYNFIESLNQLELKIKRLDHACSLFNKNDAQQKHLVDLYGNMKLRVERSMEDLDKLRGFFGAYNQELSNALVHEQYLFDAHCFVKKYSREYDLFKKYDNKRFILEVIKLAQQSPCANPLVNYVKKLEDNSKNLDTNTNDTSGIGKFVQVLREGIFASDEYKDQLSAVRNDADYAGKKRELEFKYSRAKQKIKSLSDTLARMQKQLAQLQHVLARTEKESAEYKKLLDKNSKLKDTIKELEKKIQDFESKK